MDGLPQVWTAQRLLESSGFKPRHLRRALRRTVKALDAQTPKRVITKGDTVEVLGGEPDHDIRLRASAQLFSLVGLSSRRPLEDDAGRPLAINIAIVSSDAAGHASQVNGLAVRFVGGDRDAS